MDIIGRKLILSTIGTYRVKVMLHETIRNDDF